MTLPDSFTIRVYGLLIDEGRILLSRENIYGDVYTKFPGGGLEFGEGVTDCLKREIREEVGIEISEWQLFHLNENFLASAFHESKQVLSIYYRVGSDEINRIKTGNPEDLSKLKLHSDQVLYWVSLNQLSDEPIELPIDRQVVSILLDKSDNQRVGGNSRL